MNGMRVGVAAAYACQAGPKNCRRWASSAGIRNAKNRQATAANAAAHTGFPSSTCVPTAHTSHPR